MRRWANYYRHCAYGRPGVHKS
ncbi:hypothetical protein NKJ13_30360 [Mesorhizobium sp. M0174]